MSQGGTDTSLALSIGHIGQMISRTPKELSIRQETRNEGSRVGSCAYTRHTRAETVAFEGLATVPSPPQRLRIPFLL